MSRSNCSTSTGTSAMAALSAADAPPLTFQNSTRSVIGSPAEEATHRSAHVLDRINPPRAAVDLSPRPATFGCELVEGRHDAGSKLAHERIIGEVVELGADQVHAGERGLHAWIFERVA